MNAVRQRLYVRALEDRTAPALFTVTNESASSFTTGSLGWAINQSNSNPGQDVIDFAPNLSGQILVPFEFKINQSLAILGPGSSEMELRMPLSTGRIFNTQGAPANADITIKGLRMLQGNEDFGGLILGGDEALTVEACSFSSSHAEFSGGAICMQFNGVTTIRDCTFSSLSAGVAGGAIAAAGITAIQRCTLSGNSAKSGGAIYAYYSMLIENCTLSGNKATSGKGGAAYWVGSGSILQSTLSGNSASSDGGAVAQSFFVSGGTLAVQNNTITNNTSGGKGGGIARISSSGTIAIESSIISGNISTSTGSDVSSTGTVNVKNSAIGSSSGFTLTNQGGNLAIGANLKLLPLLNNGGVMLTHMPASDSPLVDNGSNPSNFGTDQRGTSFQRAFDFDYDIGAIEARLQAPNIQLVDVGGGVTSAGVMDFEFKITYAAKSGVNVSSLDIGDLKVTGPGFGFDQVPVSVVKDTVNGTPTIATYKINAPFGGFKASHNGVYTITMQKNQVESVNGYDLPFGPAGTFTVAVPQVFTVNATNDESTNSDGKLCLREAIAKANSSLGVDTIDFAPGLTGTITLTLGEIAINEAVTVVGPGAANLTVSGNKASRIFNINPAPAAAAISISGLTLINGKASNGGAIFGQDEFLSFNQCVLTGNSATQSGGVFYASGGGTLTATGCTITNNSAFNAGGAFVVINSSKTILNSCNVSGNTAIKGGGIYVTTYLLIDQSTIANNSATNSFGGGVRAVGAFAAGALTIRNSTISGNSAAANGGGIGLFGFTGSMVVQNSTITANTTVGAGGGIRLESGTGSISLESSIVSGNSSATAPDISSSSTVTMKNCAVGSNNGFTMTNQGGNLPFQAHANLKLGPLSNNGGPTTTHALLVASPCINAGTNSANLTTDQRSTGFVRVVGAAIDIGAVELQPPPCVAGQIVVNNGDAQRSRVTSIRVDFDRFVNLPANPINAFQLERISDNALVGLAAAVTTDTVTHVTLTFTAGAIETGSGFVAPFSLKDGRYRLTVFASQVSAEGGQLDGDCNGTGGDNFVLNGDPATNTLFRIFGDITGDGAVAANDFIEFRQFFNGVNAAFDFDNDGSVSASDFVQFRLRFNGSI